MARPRGHRLNRVAWDDLLRLQGLSVTTVAELADIPRPTISGLAGGHQRASVPMAHRLADAVGCSAGTLFPSLGSSMFAEVEVAS